MTHRSRRSASALSAPALALLVGLAAAPGAGAATVSVSNGTLVFAAAPGETNTAVITQTAGALATANAYFVADQNPAVTLTGGSGCMDSDDPFLASLGVPPNGYVCGGFLNGALAPTALDMNLGDGDDTGLIGTDGNSPPPATIDGGAGNDQLVGDLGPTTFNGGDGTDTVAYVSVPQAEIRDTAGLGVTVALPAPGGAASGGNGAAGENDTIAGDVEGLVGSNGSDALAGNDGPNTIAGAAPPGTPGGVTTAPAGADTIAGNGGADTLVGGDTGSVSGGDGDDQLIGGRSTAGTTVVRGGAGNDTVISGLGNDDVAGDAGANRLAYASVQQGPLTIVDRGTTGVAVGLPDPGGPPTLGGARGGAERDTVGQGFSVLVGSSGDDVLTGGSGPDTLVGAAPAGTAGVRPGPSGNDALAGGEGSDTLLGAEGADRLLGGGGTDTFIAAAGDDQLDSRDAAAEAPSCGAGNDRLVADALDTVGADCESVDKPAAAVAAAPAKDTKRPTVRVRPTRLTLQKRRRISLVVSCANEPTGCRGTLKLATRDRVRLGRAKARRYTLATRSIRLTTAKPRRVRIALPKRTLRIVRRGRSVRLRATLVLRDASGNRTTKRVTLRLRRR